MKPNLETVDQTKPRDSFARSADLHLPLTDCNYHSVALGDHNKGCARVDIPAFRNISRDYFKNEARQSFIGEASFFVMMVLTAAAGLASSAYALADFVRAISGI